jgi:hypothetical protein
MENQLGIWSFAKGGISAAAGQITTTSGPTSFGPFVAGDNPGGRETVAFIPRNNPIPTLERLFSMFFGSSHGGKDGDININLQTRIDGNGIINDRTFDQRVKGILGNNQRRFR